ncbi:MULTISPECIES: PTS sugar transporter subunit IIA [unclassified Rhizobium]|uniref:PTS sugar transporter subunit IIA n=1 Tax=unclassified Rhizobium TaxID=2613769 RepID=UPI001ADA811D|nr:MULTISPECIES: PTS sugar transporter subunit IIA [unclassified Rhizobium]MBO9100617.1 PTS sugar transporter subunit IIA [Rhizobium sp. L58/93]MBO9136021.1 PTS sugar transporter subunit IIA [Rhizobium sp. B209b/85]MBO9171332.1 PTS sugar transporter subunit IIA [Rhizobium sp. L245/93]MBO9187199.1 PTS sugar transporter subunit IIA [Rhizobium sp. E27B/91]QXZ87885.1 PTS sugar transporter subunit IIA [Rhizobium sp. K1/93]
MPTLLDILEPEAILLDVRATTAEEVIRLLAARLETLGYVKTTYADAVVSREKNLPTGLPLERDENVAVPHTDPEHVIKAGVAMATLSTPVVFANMEEPEELLPVGTVFLLAINDKDKQIETLQQIIEAIQSPTTLDGLKRAKTLHDVRVLLGSPKES